MWRSVRVFASARSRRTTLLLLVFVLALLVGGSLFVHRTIPKLTDPESLRGLILGFGVWAPIVFIGLQATQVIVAPIPGQVLGFVSGFLFGAYWGTVYSVVGAVLGSYIVFRLSRRFGRPFVESAIHHEALDQFDDLSGKHGLFVLFLLFLIPGLPDDTICFVAGLTDLDVKRMVFVSFIGRLPGYFLVNLAGAQLAEAQFVETGVLIGALVLVSLLAYLKRETITTRVFAITGK